MRPDDELRAQFRELRRADGGDVPDFRAVVDRPVLVHPRPALYRLPGVWIVAAAAVVIGVVTSQRFFATNDAAAQSITNWQSPTGSLVPASEHVVLSPPPLLSSVLDGATASTLWRKGD